MTWGKRVTGVVLGAGLCVAALAAPAWADDTAPHLLGASRTSPSVLPGGGLVVVSVQANDPAEQGSGVASVELNYDTQNTDGALLGLVNVDSTLLAVNGTLTATSLLSPWAAQGHYALEQIVLRDLVGNVTIYNRDGSARTASGQSADPAPFALSDLDFDVSNPASDTSPPTVDDLHLVTSSPAAGGPVVVTASPSDDRAGVDRYHIGYTSPSGQLFDVVTPPTVGAAGVASGVLPLGAEGGVWQAQFLELSDRAGNYVSYRRDGAPAFYRPSGVRTFQAQPPIDWAALDINVTPRVPDTQAPVLSQVSRDSTGDLHPGDDVTFRFQVSDANPIQEVDFDLLDQGGHEAHILTQCQPERGFAVDVTPLGFDPGPVRVGLILARDAVGNTRAYYRDGHTTSNGNADTSAPPLDLTSLDFTLVSDVGTSPHTLPTRIACPDVPRLPVTVPAITPPNVPVLLSGQVLHSDGQPVSGAIVALVATSNGVTRLLGLRTADDNGAYSLSVPPLTASTAIRVQFVGAGALPPTVGDPHVVTLAQPQHVTATLPRTTISSGQQATVQATLTPRRGGATIALQVPVGTGWRTVITRSTNAYGVATFTFPAGVGTHRYRTYRPATPGWLAALSSPVSLTVR